MAGEGGPEHPDLKHPGPNGGRRAAGAGPADDAGLAPGAVARHLGVAVTTLRTWHQRYGLGPSGHLPGQHRRYTSGDLVRLEVMHRLTTRGMAAAEAAAIALRTPVGMGGPSPSIERPRKCAARIADGGTTTAALRGLLRAAMRLDGPGMWQLLDEVIGRHGVIVAWETIIVPALIKIGERHAATGQLVEVEHLLSRCVAEALSGPSRRATRRTTRERPGVGRRPQVLLACADEEQHSLPMEALSAALTEHEVASHLLGARVPGDALLAAVARTGPNAVVVWSHAASTAVQAAPALTALLRQRGRPPLLVAAGPGWSAVDLPAEIALPGSLTEAVRMVLSVANPGG